MIRHLGCAVGLIVMGWTFAGAAGGRAAPGLTQSDRSATAYEDLIRRFQGGDGDAAVRLLSEWSATEVGRTVRADQTDEGRRIVPRSNAARNKRLMAIAALHVESGIVSGDRERFRVHVAVGGNAVSDLAVRRVAPPFCRTWYLTVARMWVVLGDLIPAESALKTARRLLGPTPTYWWRSGR